MKKVWKKRKIQGAILGDNLGFGGNFNLRGGSIRGATRLPGIFFLDFLLFFFYIVFLLSSTYIILVI